MLSVKIEEPQFSGQTKERLSSRECASFVGGVIKDHFALWLNQHPESGDEIAQFAIENAQHRLKAAKQIVRKRIVAGPALPGKLADCTSQDAERGGAVSRRGRFRRRLREAGARPRVPGGHAAARQDPEHLGSRAGRAARVAGSAQHRIALGVDPGSANLDGLRYHKVCILADADSDGQHIATLLCALFVRHFRPLVDAGHVYVAMPPLFRIDVGKEVYYALDEAERDVRARSDRGREEDAARSASRASRASAR